jgi:hypothetical protein
MAPRDAFPGYDDPVNIDMEPEEALTLLLKSQGADDCEEDEEQD